MEHVCDRHYFWWTVRIIGRKQKTELQDGIGIITLVNEKHAVPDEQVVRRRRDVHS